MRQASSPENVEPISQALTLSPIDVRKRLFELSRKVVAQRRRSDHHEAENFTQLWQVWLSRGVFDQQNDLQRRRRLLSI